MKLGWSLPTSLLVRFKKKALPISWLYIMRWKESLLEERKCLRRYSGILSHLFKRACRAWPLPKKCGLFLTYLFSSLAWTKEEHNDVQYSFFNFVPTICLIHGTVRRRYWKNAVEFVVPPNVTYRYRWTLTSPAPSPIAPRHIESVLNTESRQRNNTTE